MPLKPSYAREGRRWLPISRAAELLSTNAAGIKKLMASGELEWIPLGIEDVPCRPGEDIRASPGMACGKEGNCTPRSSGDALGQGARCVAEQLQPAGAARGRAWQPERVRADVGAFTI